MRQRILYLLIAVTLIIGTIPSDTSYAIDENTEVVTRVYTDKEIIARGAKGIDYNISYIYIEHQAGYNVDSELDLKDLDKLVKIIVNGEEESPVDSKENLKYTVEYNSESSRIEIKVKENQSDLTHLKPFILRKHKHYNINIPKGFFKSKDDSSDQINYNFTTKGDGEYGEDILHSANPAEGNSQIDYNNGTITLSFIDDIKLNKDIEDPFQIISNQTTDPAVGGFDSQVIEDIGNYSVDIQANKLIFKKKTGKLDDFADYKVEIKKDVVILKNSDSLRNIKPIYNDHLTINFDTNNWIEWTDPYNNQGTIDSKRVVRNPLIKFKFKYNVELIDPSKISISSDGHFYSVDVAKDTWITYDGDILKIDINSLYRGGENPLRANAAYKITIGQGALRLKDHNLGGSDSKMENPEINLYFITGISFTPKDKGLTPIKYTSRINDNPRDSAGLDDLKYLNTTQLKKDGNIYIHFQSDSPFPRSLQWNQWTANTPVYTDEDALGYFKLYKSPQAYKRDHDSNGIVYDSEFRYNRDKKSSPLAGLDEIPLQSVEIVKDANGNNTNVVKIRPKYDLIAYNEYYIKITDRTILTDNHEKIMLEKEALVREDGKGQRIWTAPTNAGIPAWEMDLISPEQIIEVEKGPYKTTYTIHGAPNYNNLIDTQAGKPIILYADREVIVNPTNSNALGGISLYEGYRENDTATATSHKIEIEYYQLEYFYDAGIKKTKISLYPEKELRSGTYYELHIDKLNIDGSKQHNIFQSRAGESLAPIQLNFVVEGDGNTDATPTTARGIYKFQVDNKALITNPADRPFLITDFEVKDPDISFSITGYNFAEDITQLRFVRDYDGKTITIPAGNLKFHDVTKITGSISGNSKIEFARINSEDSNRKCQLTTTAAGAYDIYIDFKRGGSAPLTTPTQRFIVKDRPKVISTSPVDGDKYFNPELSFKEFTNPSENGYYIEAVFEDIGGMLKVKDQLIKNKYNEIENNHGIQVNIANGGPNLVDITKPLRYGPQDTDRYSTGKLSVYIPLTGKLEDGQKYEVFIPEENTVKYEYLDRSGKRYDLDTADRTGKGDNRCFRWTFETNYFPKADRLYEGSVPEHYNPDYPIVIDGDMFHPNTTVWFRSSDGEIFYPQSINWKDNTLYIYLPRRTLPVGLYDIIVSNGTPYDIPMGYGVFSVVEEGEYIPNEEYRVKDESRVGMVREMMGTSKDILDLDRGRSSSYLEIDLDELMGSETWVRQIDYPVRFSEYISELCLKSKWVNVNIKELTLDEDADENHIVLRAGRVEPSMADILKTKLIGENINSNFIEISGANFDFKDLLIEIPYIHWNEGNLRLLRYDQGSRKFEQCYFTVDNIDKTVEGISTQAGIFVVVEWRENS